MPNSAASTDTFYRYKVENKLDDEKTIRDCFNLFDKNKDSYIDLNEFRSFLSSLFSFNNKPYPISDDKVSKIFNYFNTKGQKIDFEEFKKIWSKLVKTSLSPKTALIIVDVQNDFVDGTMAIRNCPAKQEGAEVIPYINSLIDTVPFDAIVYTYDWHPENHCSFIENVYKKNINKYSPTKENFKVNDLVIFDDFPDIEQKLWPSHCIQGSHGSQLHPELKVVDEKTDPMKRSVIYTYKGMKPDIDSYSAFFDNFKLNETTLNNDLKKHGINELYICGLAGDVCVAATSNDALDLKYRVAFIEDASRGIVNADIIYQQKKLASRNAVIINSKQILNMVMGKDRRPELAYLTLGLQD